MAPAAAPTTAGTLPGPPGTFVAPPPRLLGTEVLSTDAGHGQEPFVSAVPRFGTPGDASIRPPPPPAATPVRPPGLLGPPGLLAPAPVHGAKPYEPGSLLVKSANLPGMPWKLQSNAGLKLPTPARSAVPQLVSGVRAAPASAVPLTQEPAADAGPAGPGSRPPSARGAEPQDGARAESAAADAPDAAGAGRTYNGHGLGLCKPCAFVFKGGCNAGLDCKFCHLCPPDEKKTRKKNWKEQKRNARDAAAAVDPTMFVNPAVLSADPTMFVNSAVRTGSTVFG